MEQKVERVFTGGKDDRIKAILYKEVDSIGLTSRHVLYLLGSGKKIYDPDAEVLISYGSNLGSNSTH
ncbi:MAG: hypothetical protein IEMM0002_0092 [bacterium]|nr:MAG: hypothetical protein IEMM0002_0092 [bacterium]